MSSSPREPTTTAVPAGLTSAGISDASALAAAQARNRNTFRYIRAKTDQLLTLLGTLPLRQEELDDDTLLQIDPIGIVADSFGQVLSHLKDTNSSLELARSEIRAIFDTMEAALLVIDMASSRVEDCNRLALDWFFCAVAASEVRGKRLHELHLDPALKALPVSGDFSLGQRHIHIVRSVLARTGDQATDSQREILLYVDLTRQRTMESRLRLYAEVFRNSAEGMFLTTPDKRIIEVNEAFCRITGYAARELIDQTPSLLSSGLHDAAYYENMWRNIDARDSWHGEILDRNRDGAVIPLLLTIGVVRNEAGQIINYFAVATDISPLKETQSRLDYLAHHDMLTGLGNRLLFNDRLEHAVTRAGRDQAGFALTFIDLDRFKIINDSRGHQVGDLVLIEAARRLQALSRKSDTVARLGGDEFVLLQEDLSDPRQGEVLAQKVLDAMRQPFLIRGEELRLGCSMGISVFPDDGSDAVTLMRNADTAMYRVKEQGRDGFCRYDRQLFSTQGTDPLTLDNALRMAVEREELLLHFQPIIALASGHVVAAEALVRWQRPGIGLVPPNEFIPLAEENRMILAIGRWVTATALRQFKSWQEAGLTLDYISVNVSAQEIAQTGFADGVIALLRDTGVAGAMLQLEMTEYVLMHNIETSLRELAALRRQGVRIAIDDFGTGYSSLVYLKQLPLDNLKVDRGFVCNIPDHASDCAIATAVIGLATTLGLSAIAEGVETAPQAEFLAAAGCATAQGYFFAGPLPAEAFPAWVQRQALPSV